MSKILECVSRIGYKGFFQGEDPVNKNEITEQYLSEQVNGVNRLIVFNGSVTAIQIQAEWDAVVAAFAEKEADLAYILENPDISLLLKKRPAVLESWIDNNVTDLASTKTVLKRYALVLKLLAGEMYE